MHFPTRVTLGPLFAPSFHRPWLRYVDAVDGGEGGNGEQQQSGDQQQQNEPGDDQVGDIGKMTEEQLRAALTKVRGEAADKRIKAREATAAETAAKAERDKILADVSKALGLQPGDKAPTAAELQAALDAATAKANSAGETNTALQREVAVARIAPTLGASTAKLLDSRGFLTKLSAVDPSDAEAVKAAIKAALDEDRTFAVGAGSSGSGQHSGGDATHPKTLADAVSAAYGTK